jgi:hypothetical protein
MFQRVAGVNHGAVAGADNDSGQFSRHAGRHGSRAGAPGQLNLPKAGCRTRWWR